MATLSLAGDRVIDVHYEPVTGHFLDDHDCAEIFSACRRS
jgi:hypothetical protein